MSIPTETVRAIEEAAQELSDAATNLLDIREAPRGDFEPEDREQALEDFESAVRVLFAAIPTRMLRE